MRKLMIWISVGVVVVQLFKTTISPQSIVISESAVTESSILIKGEITASAVGYKDYAVEESDGKLYIKVKGSSLNLFSKPIGSFDILIDNHFGKVKEVYLQGDSSSDTRLIWPELPK